MAISKTSAAHVSGALGKASQRVLSHEERLARVSTSILRTAGLAAAERFEAKARASLVAAAGEGGWTPPHEDELIDVDAVVGALRGKSDPIRRAAIEDYGSTLKRLAPELDWDVTNPLVGGVLAGAAQHVQGISDTTRINLMRIIRRSYEEGLSIEDTGKAIRAGMTGASKVRGRLIARTEMAAVTNGGALAATKLLAEGGGGPYFKRWMTAPGAHYPRHEDYEGLDGQTVALGDSFDVGGAALQFPGDPDGPPEEICNCRCSLAFVESQDEPLPGEPEPPPQMPPADQADVPLEPVDGETAPELAGAIAANAVAMEPYITEAIQAATEPLGGHLQGYEYRLKSESSIKRKIETDYGSRLPGVPPAIAASAVKDGLRYTVLYRPGEYADKMTKTLDALRAGGIEPERVRASWAKGAEYVGTNALMKAPNGYRFELQFHTPQSYNVKEFVNHDEYEIWRKISDKSSPEALALSKKMVAAADDVRRPSGIENWTYDGSVHGDIGVTPFREGVDDPVGFYDSEKFARFEKDAHELADYYNVSLDLQERATGVWEGAEEPSVHLNVHDGETGVRAYAAALGRAYRQDGVAIFTPDIGEAVIARFAGKLDTEKVYEAMAKAELPAGRFLPDGTFEVIGSGPEFVGKLDSLSRDLGVGYDAYLGKFDLLEAGSGDYEAAIADAQGARAVQARQADRAAAGLPGAPPLGEGARGAQVRSALVEPPGSLVPPPDVSPPTAPPGQTGAITDAMASRLSVDNLWGEHAAIGQAENVARAELPDLHDDRIIPLLWAKADVGLKNDALRFSDLSGDQQVHTFFSDGHNTVQQVAAEAQARGEHRVVISDHSHAMTSAEIRKQHEMIDALNDDYQRRGIDFKIEKGIEANILADGSLDVAPEVLAQFDVVNAAIHGAVVGEAQQTARLLRALDNPELDVLAHPHSVAADWDAVAAKAAQKGVALEVNGRDLLRNSRQEAAADMIDAAKRHGAKLVVGSDAHSTADLVDVLYAVRFASTHGVTPEDLAPFARVERIGVDPSTSIPGSLDSSTPGAHRLGGGMNEVWKIQTQDGREFVVKPEPDPEVFREMGFDTGEPLRENVPVGNDLGRERAAYVVSRLFNDVGGEDYHVNVPTYRIGELSTKSVATGEETRKAGIAEFIPGEEARQTWDWRGTVRDDELHSAALFDAIIGNTDRHAGNFLFDDVDENLWLIDHGLAFPAGEGDVLLQNTQLVDAWRRRAAAESGGTEISEEDAAFLHHLVLRLPEIYHELRQLLSPVEIEEMAERVDSMLRTRDFGNAIVNHTLAPGAGEPSQPVTPTGQIVPGGVPQAKV